MDNNSKLNWIHKMTAEALAHAKATPNLPTPDGKWSHDKMAAFVSGQTKLALEHVQNFDTGGTVLSGPSTGGTVNNATDPNTSGIAGGINGVLGTNNNFQGAAANTQAGTNAAQLNNAYTGVQTGLNDQGNLVKQTGAGTTQGLAAQSALSGQLSNEANGQGPNPAQAALNQSTGENIAQQAALAAGQRGAGANAGLIATQNAQTGAATQQAAVGQAATLQAQQQLAAQSAEANLAATQVGQGATAVQNENQQQQNEQNILQGANTSNNNANVAMQSNINNVNSQTSAANQNQSANTVGGLLSAASSISSLFAKGGLVRMDKGGKVLDANARKHIAPENFALPGGRYPIHDESHARNALARVSQNGTPAEKAKVKAAVSKKFPSIGARKMADGGDVTNGDDTPAFQSSPSDASSGPSVPSTASLPASTANYGQDMGGESGGGGGGGGGLMSLAALLANGGQVRKMALGGYLQMAPLQAPGAAAPSSFVGRWVNSNVSPSNGPTVGATGPLAQSTENLSKDVPGKAAPKDKTPKGSADTTGKNLGATDLVPDPQMQQQDPLDGANATEDQAPEMMNAYNGGLMKSGGNVKAGKGQKAVKADNSYDNDKIPTMLSQDEIVLPRSITTHPMAPEKAAEFVRMTLAKRKK